MADKTFLFAGLGNPGGKYAKTWHNLGFFVMDELASRYSVEFKSGKGDYYYANFTKNNCKITLLKPTTYMNDSGRAVKHALDYFDYDLSDLVVVYDEINLPLNNLRLRETGSAGGHNGVKSIITHLGSQNFPRLRVGFSNDHIEKVLSYDRSKLPDLVLSNIPEKLYSDVEIIIKNAADCLEELLEKEFKHIMNKYNKRNKKEEI